MGCRRGVLVSRWRDERPVAGSLQGSADDDAGGGGLEGGEPEEVPAEGEGAEPIQAMLAKMNTYPDAQSFYNSIIETDKTDESDSSEDSDAADAVDD